MLGLAEANQRSFQLLTAHSEPTALGLRLPRELKGARRGGALGHAVVLRGVFELGCEGQDFKGVQPAMKKAPTSG